MKARFHHLQQHTPSIKTFWFKPDKPIRFIAGQYIELYLPHDTPDSRGLRRWFTISSSPTEQLLSITTKLTSPNGSSFKQALCRLQPGDSVEISNAMGDFVLPKLPSVPLVFVAGGIGITPFVSMFEWLVSSRQQRDIRFLYAVKKESDIVFQDLFSAASINATIIVSEPSSTWDGLRGGVDASTIIGLEKPDKDVLIYLSGPEAMTQSLQHALVASGITPSQLVTDEFPGYSSL